MAIKIAYSWLKQKWLQQKLHLNKFLKLVESVQNIFANLPAFPRCAFQLYKMFPGADFPKWLIENLVFPSFLSVSTSSLCIALLHL